MKVPLRIRLALASCGVFLVVIAALEVVAYMSVGTAIRSIVDHELETRLAGLDDHLTRHIPHVPWPQLSESLKVHPAFQPDLLRIDSEDGQTLFEGSAFRGLLVPQALDKVSIRTSGSASRMFRILTVRRKIDGRVYRLVLGTDLFFSARILGRLWLLMVLSLPAVLLISGGAGYWISGRAIAPVCGIIAAARSIDSAHLSERIEVPSTGDEIQRLAETMNGMLARIEEGFHRIRQFTANASHELRTPLAIIRANAEVALLDNTDRSGKSTRDALRRILKEAERDSALLEDMLHLARAGADAVTNAPPQKVVDLRASLITACSDFRPVAAARGLNLRISSSGAVCQAGDADQLRRLWFILLDNALKYTPDGGTISVNAGTTADGRPFVDVADTGIGIDDEHRAHIFEPFYRVDKARSRSQGGAGLGLAIAQNIVASHGAVLNLKSEPGHGSVFTVTFPVAATPAESHPSEAVSPIFR